MIYVTYITATGQVIQKGFGNEAITPINGQSVYVVTDRDYSDIKTSMLRFDCESAQLVSLPEMPSANHTFNYTTKQWEDPRTLADLKAEKWRNIKANRDAAEHGGFTWDGSVFDSDALSQQRITGAVTLAQMSPAFTTVWTLKDNATRTLSAADMFAVGVALGTHVSTQFLQGQLLRAQIDEAATAQEVEAIHW